MMHFPFKDFWSGNVPKCLTLQPPIFYSPSLYYEAEEIQLDAGSTSPYLTSRLCSLPEKPSEGEGVWYLSQEMCLFRK